MQNECRQKISPRLRHLKAPVYFSIGNHERYAGLDWVIPMLEDAGVVVLRSQAVKVGELQLIGIDDAEDEDQVRRELSTIELDPECFKVLLYHRPLGWESAVRVGNQPDAVRTHPQRPDLPF